MGQLECFDTTNHEIEKIKGRMCYALYIPDNDLIKGIRATTIDGESKIQTTIIKPIESKIINGGYLRMIIRSYERELTV